MGEGGAAPSLQRRWEQHSCGFDLQKFPSYPAALPNKFDLTWFVVLSLLAAARSQPHTHTHTHTHTHGCSSVVVRGTRV